MTQFRGFEKFCEGRPFSEMPSLMARICGICPVSHLIASAKACDAILAVRIPPTADKLRRILEPGADRPVARPQLLLSRPRPTCCSAWTPIPRTRNIFGVMENNPEIARDGIRLRQFGQQIIERLGGKRIHPAWVVPGGVSEPLTAENRDGILAGIPEVLAIAERTLEWFKASSRASAKRSPAFANFPHAVHGHGQERRWPRLFTTEACASSTPPATSSPTGSIPPTISSTSARRSNPGAT